MLCSKLPESSNRLQYFHHPSHQVNKILKEVRLCQVDGFISALSLLRAKMMIKNGQRPYAHIEPGQINNIYNSTYI